MFRWPPLAVSTGFGVGPQVNKFEQVSSDDHQRSVAGGVGSCLLSGGGVRYSDVQYIMGNGHMGPLPHCGQTDARENITFLQLCLQAVRIGIKR